MAVLTIGSFSAGLDNNVISDQAILKGNLRWYDPKVRTTLNHSMKIKSKQLLVPI